MHSLSVEVGSRGYNVYRETRWRKVQQLHEHVVVLKEVNNISIGIDPYCCRIMKIVDRIEPVTVRHVPRELSRFIYFIQEGSSVTETVASITPRISPDGGLEVPILMYFIHENKAVSSKMEILVRKQVEKMKKTFDCRDISPRELFWKLSRRKPYMCRRKRRKRTSWRRFYNRSRIRQRRKKCNCNWPRCMIEKKQKTENIREKISSGCFSFLNNGWRKLRI